MTYGGLAFEFYELLADKEITLDAINNLIPGSRSDFFAVI